MSKRAAILMNRYAKEYLAERCVQLETENKWLRDFKETVKHYFADSGYDDMNDALQAYALKEGADD